MYYAFVLCTRIYKIMVHGELDVVTVCKNSLIWVCEGN